MQEKNWMLIDGTLLPKNCLFCLKELTLGHQNSAGKNGSIT